MWFADSEETSVTNAVQILSNTEGLDNHVIRQVAILLRELCRLHAVPEPPDIDRLKIPNSQTFNRYLPTFLFISVYGLLPMLLLKSAFLKASASKTGVCFGSDNISNGEEQMEDEGVDSDVEPDVCESECEESDSEGDDLAMEMEDGRSKGDEMCVEHLATLERLRQNQRQDYLKVSKFFIRYIHCMAKVWSKFVEKVGKGLLEQVIFFLL